MEGKAEMASDPAKIRWAGDNPICSGRASLGEDDRLTKANTTLSADRVLLTVLGTSPKETTYQLRGQTKTARFAPVALMDLLRASERPRRVVALCTTEAEKSSFPLLADALGQDQSPKSVRIPDGNRQEDIDTFLAKVVDTDVISRDTELTVDVTHGPRSFSFLMYVAVLYMVALRGVRVKGAYYAKLSHPGPSPFLDLRPVLDLPRWTYALRVLEETGSTRPLAAILDDGPGNKRTVSMIARDFDDLGKNYLSGLPLELGRGAARIRQQYRKPLRRLLVDDYRLPRADQLFARLGKLLDRFAFDEPYSDNPWKRNAKLSETELERQARVVDHLLKHGSTATGVGLMLEWTQTWAVRQIDESADWLDRDMRKQAWSRLHAIRVVHDDRDLRKVLTEDQRRLGSFWDKLCDVRNAYHHHGMRPQDTDGTEFRKKLCRVRTYWACVLRSCPDIPLALGDPSRNRVLVSPIGERPGVLFSALKAFKSLEQDDPTLCLVVCSGETGTMVDEALSKAGYAGSVERLVLDDPFHGVMEMKKKVKSMRGHFIGAAPVVVNVTGGTTLMGLATQELARGAERLACPVRWFGLIDRRGPEEQVADPYEVGELFLLNSEGDDGAN